MPKWEYKVLEIELYEYLCGDKLKGDYAQELNKLGSEGWELVGILHGTLDGNLLKVQFILKRQI